MSTRLPAPATGAPRRLGRQRVPRRRWSPRRPRPPPRPSTSSSSSGGADPRTSAATGSAMPACASVSSRQTARSASLPGSSEPISSARPSTCAPPRVAISSASRTVIACGPPLARANSSACRSSSTRLAPRCSPRRRPPARPGAGGAQVTGPRDPRAEPGVRRRAVRHPGAGLPPVADRLVVQVDGVREPHVVPGPAQLLDVLQRRAAEPLAAEVLLVRVSARCVCSRTPRAGPARPPRASARRSPRTASTARRRPAPSRRATGRASG